GDDGILIAIDAVAHVGVIAGRCGKADLERGLIIERGRRRTGEGNALEAFLEIFYRLLLRIAVAGADFDLRAVIAFGEFLKAGFRRLRRIIRRRRAWHGFGNPFFWSLEAELEDLIAEGNRLAGLNGSHIFGLLPAGK